MRLRQIIDKYVGDALDGEEKVQLEEDIANWANSIIGKDEEYNYKDMTDNEYNEADARHYGNRVRYEMRQKIKEQLK